ncbi:MAG: PH domain-containing protein [Planctomycetota bacterium]|jgi:membrane protein YdbS with pleckstrin-like domain
MIGGDENFVIRRDTVARYLYWRYMLVLVFMTLVTFGIGSVAVLVYLLLIGPWFPRRQASALRYALEGTTLRVDSGVFFLSRKAIPLDRVTDIVLVQGPLMRHFGVWSLRVQTAGAGSHIPEGVLFGVEEPERVRDLLLETRDEAASGRSDAGGG